MLDGFTESYGVNYEIDLTHKLDKPVVYMKPGIVPSCKEIYAGPQLDFTKEHVHGLV
jgi:hypothetical protein